MAVSTDRRPPRHRVATVVVDGMSPLELAVAAEFFGNAPSGVDPDTWYDHRFCTERSGRVAGRAGPDLWIDADLGELARADTVIIPGWCGINNPPSAELVDALVAAHHRGARLMSMCTGAFVLAAAGLLDGRRATTHWARVDDLARRHPLVIVDPNVLYVGDDHILTSAGSAASIDLALHVIRSDHGAAVANAAARDLVVPPHREGGQAQFIDTPVPTCPDVDPMAGVLDWALAHLAEPLTVDDLAAVALMSPRTFARRFRAATGTTPNRWVTSQRISMAQRLLESTDLSVDEVAARVGFGAAATLRLHFGRQLQVSPRAYRRTFACGPHATTAARA